MVETELAWAAGLFDGEGTATLCNGRRRLSVRMADEELVKRFARAVEVGTVYGPYLNRQPRADGGKRLPSFAWIADGENADAVADLLFPWLGSGSIEKFRRVTIFGDIKT